MAAVWEGPQIDPGWPCYRYKVSVLFKITSFILFNFYNSPIPTNEIFFCFFTRIPIFGVFLTILHYTLCQFFRWMLNLLALTEF